MRKIFYTFSFIAFAFLAKAQVFTENFNYTGALYDSLTFNGWTSISGGSTNGILANATGLVYTGYAGSGIGTAAAMTTSGQDVVKDASVAMTSGAIYTSFLMKVTAAQTGDYFLSLVAPASTTAFFGRVHLKATASAGYCQIGISKASTTSAETAVYQTDSLALNTTYLVVMKYQFNTVSTTDDSCKVFVFSSGIPATEPALGKAATIGGTNTDATSLQRVLLRQGSASAAATVIVDGIRVGTTWASAPLPVSWKSFTATKGSDANTLKWSTASETNNSHFEIQRSIDGKKYEIMATVKGAGNSAKASYYSFEDKDRVSSKTVYYRLKQVDFDGNSSFSKTVSIAAEAKSGLDASLPNPFNDALTVTFNSASASTATVTLMDMIGKVYFTSEEHVTAGANKVNIETTDMPNGIYFVRVSSNGETFTQKVIKK
jgi:hypothetical protein